MLFDVPSARALRAACRRLHPGARLATDGTWPAPTEGHRRRPLAELLQALGDVRGRDAAPPLTLWYWRDSEEAFRAQAGQILRHVVYPLVAAGQPHCVGLPFGAEVLEPGALAVAERARLDLEDIGVLLGGAIGPPPLSSAGRAAVAADHGLDPGQRAAVAHGAGAARVLAPAGSGKTKTLVARVCELVARGADPAAILLLAFNTKAALQLEERLAARGIPCTRRIDLSAVPGAVHCATFNAFGARYQREVMRRRTEVDSGGSATLRALMKQALEEAGCGLALLKPARGTDPLGMLLAALPRVRAGLEPPESVWLHVLSNGDQPVVTLPFAAIHERYTRLQGLAGRQSFDDQIYFAVVDLLASPNRRRLLQGHYRHILVDEFQDLNAAQLALVDVLSRPYRNLFIVGDDDQLIYGWRHADPDAILGFHERMPRPPHAVTYALGTNYRCSRAVITAAERLITRNQRREQKTMAPRPGAQEGAVLFATAPSWAERGAAMCAFLHGERSRLGCAWRDLARRNRIRAQQIAVALALDAGGVPREPAASGGILSDPAARLVRACLTLVCTPAQLADADLAQLAKATAPGDSRSPGPPAAPQRPAACAPPDPIRRLHQQAATLRARLNLVADPGAPGAAPSLSVPATPASFSPPDLTSAHLLAATLDAFGLAARWRGPTPEPAAPDSPEAVPRDAQHGDSGGVLRLLDALALLADTFPQPADFLSAWDRLAAEAEPVRAREPEPDTDAEPPDRVALATIHAAKGREYHSVVIPDYDCDLTHWRPAEIEEERRVLYVGVTRACDSLLLTIDSSRPYVHPFLRELVPTPDDDELVRLRERLAAAAPAAERERLQRRLTEIETLFPDLVQASGPAAQNAGAAAIR